MTDEPDPLKAEAEATTEKLRALLAEGHASPEFRRGWTELRPVWREALDSGIDANVRLVLAQLDRLCDEEQARKDEEGAATCEECGYEGLLHHDVVHCAECHKLICGKCCEADEITGREFPAGQNPLLCKTCKDNDPLKEPEVESAGICAVCDAPLLEAGGCGGTGLCGPCATGEADTAGEY